MALKLLINNPFARNTVLKNFSILTTTNILIQLISILSSIRVARLLQPTGYGIYNLLSIQVSLFSIVAVYGLRLVVIRYIARNKEDSLLVFKITNKIRIITSLISILLLVLYNEFQVGESKMTLYLTILVIFQILFQSFSDSIESIAFGHEKMHVSGVINLAGTILWIVAVYLVPVKSFNISVIFSIFTLIQLFKTFTYYFWLKTNILSIFNKSDNSQLNKLYFVKQSSYFFTLGVFTAIQTQLPILILSHQAHVDQVGIFNIGYKILMPLQMVINMALTALYPSFARLAITNLEMFASKIKSLLLIILTIGFLGCIGFTLFSKEVVLLMYGQAYIDSVNVILVQTWFTVVYGVFCVTGTVLNSLDKQKVNTYLSIIQGVLSIPFFYYGAKFGAYGLAWAFVIAGIFNMSYIWIVFVRMLKPFLSIKFSLIYLSVLLVGISSVFISNNNNFDLFYRILIFACVFIISFFVIRSVTLKLNRY